MPLCRNNIRNYNKNKVRLTVLSSMLQAPQHKLKPEDHTPVELANSSGNPTPLAAT
jgi:hypothetical protein